MNPSAGNLMRMQQEAADRVKRMQEHSRRMVQEYPVHVYRGVTFTPPEEAVAEPIALEPPPPDTALPCGDEPGLSAGKSAPLPNTEGALAALLQGDQEQLLVLLLAVILAKNGAPLELVLALLYVAM